MNFSEAHPEGWRGALLLPRRSEDRFETMVIPAQRRYLAGAAGVADLVFPMDWGDECVARAAEAVEGNTSALPSAPTKGTNP